MQVSVQWLREWVDLGDVDETAIGNLAHQLTMSGLEIEAIERAAPICTGVVVAEVVSVERHPEAEKLSICKVNAGNEQLQIVCGAANVRAGLRVPLAQVGARLPGGAEIKKAKLRGVESFGMLCSARELGLADDSSGLLELPDDYQIGVDLNASLALDDRVLTVNLTPNRGDCMSVAGIAREVAAIRGAALRGFDVKKVTSDIKDALPVQLVAGTSCSKFASRVIRGVRANTMSPLWLRERLRRAGVRSINAVVDVTNYVMLEYGQPMHAYDLAALQGGVSARMARVGEKLTLLDGREIELEPDVLVIADEATVLGLAGVMGGQRSGISEKTSELFLEVAHFAPDAIAGRGRRYGLVTDASQRFERGVDPMLPEVVIERATQLILALAGGAAGPTTVASLPVAATPAIRLRFARIQRVLGIEITRESVVNYLENIGMMLAATNDGWDVAAPTWRFDIRIEEDLIEELARLYGYDRLPVTDAIVSQQLGVWTETRVRADRVADALADRGYQEAITYSFIAPQQHRLFCPDEKAATLSNPISAELAVMRASLWPGLAMAARDNTRRQQDRVRLFEIGRKFIDSGEVEVVAAIATGRALPEQWSHSNNKIDFFDMKADVESLLQLTGEMQAFRFEASAANPALHPGQAAQILRDGRPVGWLGALHPKIVEQLDLTYPALVFELETDKAMRAAIAEFREISIFPAIRRDLAVIVDENIDAHTVEQAVRRAAGQLLQELRVLSVYRGEQIGNGKKSMALGLNLQDTSRTLTDADAEQIMSRVVQQLRQQLDAVIRDK